MANRALSIAVFKADEVIASDGVTKGEPLSFADELLLDDVYRIAPDAQLSGLDLISSDSGLTAADRPDHPVHLDCCLTLMGPDGGIYEGLVLVETSGGDVFAIYLLPLGELKPQVEYRLVGVERHTATKRFAEAASGSFARGTRITMADGQMRPIEDLAEGDMVLTRDAGRQPVRCVRQTTLRATGSFAPVVIAAGAMHNEGELVLRPDHRLFVYQRQDKLGAGRSEVLIKARQLVNGHEITRRRGGFVDYFQLVFDDHHIIYAEGIAAESQLVDDQTRAAMPDDVAGTTHRHRPHLDYEVSDNLIPFAEAAALLRKASKGEG